MNYKHTYYRFASGEGSDKSQHLRSIPDARQHAADILSLAGDNGLLRRVRGTKKRKGVPMGAKTKTLFIRRLNRWRLRRSPLKVAFLLFLWLITIASEMRAGDLKNTGTINNNGTIKVKNQAIGLPSNINGTVEFFGSTQSVPAKNYNNLNITGTGTNNTVGGVNFSVNGDLSIASTAQLNVEAGKVITLNGSLIEQGYLSGSIQKFVDLSFTPTDDFGGIGTTLSWSGTTPGLTTVKRTSGIALNGGGAFSGNQSIKRYYDVALSSSGFNGTFDFKYNPTHELNSLDENTLELWRSTDGGASWRRQGGTVNTTNHTITKTGVLAFSRWTASDATHPLGSSSLEWAAQNISGTSGSGQSGSLNSTLGNPFIVTVTDGYGNLMASIPVTFAIAGTPGGATGQNLSVTNTVTNASGQASTVLQLGSVAGTYTVTATSGSLAGSPISITATAMSGAPPPPPTSVATSMILATGNSQVDTVGRQLANSMVITVLNQFGAPFAGAPVNFAISARPLGDASATLSVTSVNTNASGQASTRLTLGTKPGTYTVAATSTSLSGVSISFNSSAVTGSAFALGSPTGNGQSQDVKSTLTQPYVVTVLDVFGNPIQGVSVRFAITRTPSGASGQAITDTLVLTNAQGRAQTTLTLGDSVGVYEVSGISGTLLGSPRLFTAMATSSVLPPAATSLVLKTGSGQNASVGSQLANPFVVTVFDQFGNPFAGATVNFAIAGKPSGDTTAAITVLSAVTNASGQASTRLTLGTKVGSYTVVAKSTALPGVSVVFNATASGGRAALISMLSGNGQSQAVKTTLTLPFVALVTDSFGNPSEGENVRFAITKAPAGAIGQLLSGVQVSTDVDGRAQTVLTLGDSIGVYEVSATSGTLQGSPVSFTTMATSGTAKPVAVSVKMATGNTQIGVVASQVANPFVVTVFDQFGKPYPGATVNFAVAYTPGSDPYASLTSTTVVTDANGQASTSLIVGHKAGTYVVVATSGNLPGSPVAFAVSGVAGRATYLSQVSGNNQSAPAKSFLPERFVVSVTDTFGNVQAGATVQFAITSAPSGATGQTLSLVQGVSDSTGRVEVQLKLGDKAGVYEVKATSSGLNGSPVIFTSTATIAAPVSIAYTAGDKQSAQVFTTLASPFVVTVLNAEGNPVSGVAVRFAVALTPIGSTGALLSDTLVLTDASGRASSRLTLGTKVGGYTVTATSGTLTGSPVSFTATAVAGRAIYLLLAAGDNQTGLAANALSEPLTVAVTDSFGNAKQGVTVSYAITSSPDSAVGQVLTNTSAVTDAEGLATVRLTLGSRIGLYRVSASAASLLGSPVVFNVAATTIVGSNQVGIVSNRLQQPFSTLVLDQFGKPVVGALVTFTIDSIPNGSSGASFNGSTMTTVRTDSTGMASVFLTLGNQIGTYRVTASSPSLTGGAVIFRATAVSAVSQPTMVYRAGDAQWSQILTQLANPVEVSVLDANGSPKAGQTVTFGIVSAPKGAIGHLVTPATVTTDVNGRASALVKLGNKVGAYRIAAASTGIVGSPVEFDLSAIAGAAASLVQISGDQQTKQFATVLDSAFAVRVVDIGGNPVPGVTVQFSIDSIPSGATGQIITPTSATTDAQGRATAVLKLGDKIGVYKIASSAIGLSGSPIEFRARATAGVARTLLAVSGEGQTKPIGVALDTAFVVRVVDQGNNPVSGVPVQFSLDSSPNGATGQRLTVLNSVTDALGQASAILTLGTKVGAYVVNASSTALAGSLARFTSSASVGSAAAIVLTSGNDQSAFIFSELAAPFVVTLVDIGGNPVAGVNVQFALDSIPRTAVGQSLRIINSTTNASGQASAILRLGNKEGRYLVLATSPNLIVGSVRFAATATVLTGDVNANSMVDIADLTTVVEHILGKIRLTGIDSVKADFNRNGRIDVVDIVAMQNYLLTISPVNTSIGTLDKDPLLPMNVALAAGHSTNDVKGEFVIAENGVRFNLTNAIPVKGAQLIVRFKPGVSIVRPDVIFDRARVDSFYYDISGNEMRIVAYNMRNVAIPAGDGPLFRLPMKISDTSSIESAQLIVSKGDSTVIYDQALARTVTVRKALQGEIPASFILFQNYPNPFNERTKIDYEIADATSQVDVIVQVFNTLGQKVKTLVSGRHAGGRFTVVWDGTDDGGNKLSSGSYYYRLISGSFISSKKMIMLK